MESVFLIDIFLQVKMRISKNKFEKLQKIFLLATNSKIVHYTANKEILQLIMLWSQSQRQILITTFQKKI